MTNEDAIIFLKNQQNEIKGWIDQVKGYAKEAAQQGIDAYDMAISALEDKGYEQGYADGWAECLDHAGGQADE